MILVATSDSVKHVNLARVLRERGYAIRQVSSATQLVRALGGDFSPEPVSPFTAVVLDLAIAPNGRYRAPQHDIHLPRPHSVLHEIRPAVAGIPTLVVAADAEAEAIIHQDLGTGPFFQVIGDVPPDEVVKHVERMLEETA